MRFHLFTLLLLTPLSLTAPTTTTSLTVRDPLPAPEAYNSPSALTSRQAATPEVDLTAALDKLSEFLKTLFDNIDFSTLQKRQDTDAIVDALNAFIKEAVASLGAALREGNQKRQAQGVDLTETFDKLAEFLKNLFANIDFNKVGKRQAPAGTDAIIDALNEFIKEAVASLGAALRGAGNVKRQAQAGGVDLTETFDKLAEFLKQLFANIDFNKVGKRQAPAGTDAIIDALNEFIKEAVASLGAALKGAGNVKRQAQAGGVDLTETFDRLAEFLKQLFQNIPM